MRLTVLLLTIYTLLAGCNGTASQPAPFEGYWRKYEDESGGFVEFQNGQITLGDQSDSSMGPYTYEAASEEEPLYQVHADFPDGKEDFQLYYESDTINLISDNDKVEGMYEIIVELIPIEP